MHEECKSAACKSSHNDPKNHNKATRRSSQLIIELEAFYGRFVLCVHSSNFGLAGTTLRLHFVDAYFVFTLTDKLQEGSTAWIGPAALT